MPRATIYNNMLMEPVENVVGDVDSIEEYVQYLDFKRFTLVYDADEEAQYTTYVPQFQ